MKLLRVLALVATIPLIVPAGGSAGAAPPTKVGVAYDAAGLGDQGFNDMAQSGALQAEDDFKIKVFEKELVKPSGVVSDPEVVLTKLAQRSDLVVAVGFTYQEAADLAAAADPDTNFAVLDSVPVVPQSNLLGTTVAANEGSFLVGAAAAMESSTGQIGFIGGVDIPVVLEFEAGFSAGVDYADPAASVSVEYISLVPDFSGFNDPARAYEIAMAMYETGIDVIYHAAGASGVGLFQAARDYSEAHANHVWAIGVDSDQYLQVPDDLKPYVLTSMIKRIDVVAHDVIASQAQGTFTGGHEHWDLSRNGVDYATSGGFIDLLVPALENIRQDIIDGVITVPNVPIVRTGDRITLLGITVATYPADTAFHVEHGFGALCENLPNPSVLFELYIDGESQVPTSVSIECFEDGVGSKLFLFNFPVGLSQGPHTFIGRWCDPDWVPECFEEEAVIQFLASG